MDINKYANITDMAIKFLGEAFGKTMFNTIPEKSHMDEAICNICGNIAAQYMAEGKATLRETMLACQLVSEMLADVWETQCPVDKVIAAIDINMNDCEYNDHDVATLGAEFPSEKDKCYANICKLINDRACNGKLYDACVEQIVDILDELSYYSLDNECAIYCAMMNKLKSLLKVK